MALLNSPAPTPIPLNATSCTAAPPSTTITTTSPRTTTTTPESSIASSSTPTPTPTPTTTPTPPKQAQPKKQPDPCSICLSPITARAIALPCNHWTFDFPCLATWARSRSDPTCPLCKVRLEGIEYEFREGGGCERVVFGSGGEGDGGRDWGRDWRRDRTVPRSRNRWGPRSGYGSGSGYERHRERERERARKYPRSHPLCLPSSNPPPAPPHTSPRSESYRIKPHEPQILAARRSLYSQNQYSAHIGSNPSNKYRDFSPAEFRASPSLQSRARTWVRRELGVFAAYGGLGTGFEGATDMDAAMCMKGGRGEAIDFATGYTLSLLSSIDLKRDPERAITLLYPFLWDSPSLLEGSDGDDEKEGSQGEDEKEGVDENEGEGRDEKEAMRDEKRTRKRRSCTKLFLHELIAWLRSPYKRVEEWDCVVQYCCAFDGGEGRERGRMSAS
ncbi:MAG: hypothetical protein M1828_004780 [Chrysothrix sp. TS-e1954]|nr:MAG: hypothetical protein M1828_004780 [Chrysothrix sp. TS-e1954]